MSETHVNVTGFVLVAPNSMSKFWAPKKIREKWHRALGAWAWKILKEKGFVACDRNVIAFERVGAAKITQKSLLASSRHFKRGFEFALKSDGPKKCKISWVFRQKIGDDYDVNVYVSSSDDSKDCAVQS